MIEFSYDEEARACYITLDGKPDEELGVVAKNSVLSEDPVVTADYRRDGSLYGIVVLLPPLRKAGRGIGGER